MSINETSITQARKVGAAPWRHPWISEIPCNAISKRPTLHKGDAFLSIVESDEIPSHPAPAGFFM